MAFTVTIEKHIAKDEAPMIVETFDFDNKKDANKKRNSFKKEGYKTIYGDLYNPSNNQSVVTNY